MDTKDRKRSAPAGRSGQRTPGKTSGRTPERGTANTAQTRKQVRTNAPEQVHKPVSAPVRTRDPQEAKRAQQRRQSAKRAQQRQIQKQKQAARPAVEYTPPKPLQLNKLLLQLLMVLAVVLAVVVGMSVFFKVEAVVVYGNNAYSAWSVQEAAGIEGGENLLTLNRTRASGKIIASLPYVESARIGIQLPDTVNIYIEEVDVAYAVKSEDGTWWLMTSGGNVVEQIDAGTANKHTKILGVELASPVVGGAAKAVESVSISQETEEPQETTPDAAEETTAEAVEPVVKVVTGAQRLEAALVILSALERNQIIGDAASVDVTDPDNLQLWYGQRYQVLLGTTSDMERKVASMKAAISQQKDYEMGVLDVSFTQWQDQVGFTPAES